MMKLYIAKASTGANGSYKQVVVSNAVDKIEQPRWVCIKMLEIVYVTYVTTLIHILVSNPYAMKKYLFILFAFLVALNSFGQVKRPLPVIDMHLHAIGADDQGPPPVKVGAPFAYFGYAEPKVNYGETFIGALKTGAWNTVSISSPLTDDELKQQTLAVLKERNIYGVLSGDMTKVRQWKATLPDRIINAVYWDFGILKHDKLDVDSLTKLFKSGEFKVFGEVAIQYEGISAADPAMEPYFKMAEDLDIPVGIHLGTGPPGVSLLTKSRARLGSALILEDVLVKHPKLRIYAMHAGWPMIDDMIAMLYAYPQLYVDLGVINYILPQKEFDFYLQRLVNAGFGKRVMYGSDQMVWPGAIKIGIDRIEGASYLTKGQKRDILFNNATRFLELNAKQIAAMQ
ncbi:amidohydrolase family protein [Mucilaginibacter flavidus]|uniref:amidohydrolase family protein n=1 Tax=Mucilaginibacter flavidus TaxID=2949309 RepID=UPI002093EAAF|nr:amidohydrolase family protein [Mucilaginibacter flavidus]MCO5948556.1 amidohydrolase family protein [Mucilaginibacter flavidus]